MLNINTKKYFLSVLTCAILTLVTSNSHSEEASPSEAQRMLKQLGVDYSVGAFCNAIEKDRVTIVRLFHLSGLNLETQCHINHTPLYVAVDYGSYDTYRYLLDQNVDINAASSEYTVLIRAISHSQYDMVYELLRLGALAHKRHDTSALSYALLNCDPILVTALLNSGASAEERYPFDNRTPLHAAASHGCPDTTRLLLAAGAKVNAETDYGQTALFSAAVSGSLDVIKLLINAGATIDHRARSGATPLLFAVSGSHSLAVMQLLDAGADPNQVYRMTPQETPFAIPGDSGLRDAITVGATPLMIAAALGDSEVIEILLRNGADATTSVKGELGTHTASTIAASAGFDDLSKHLQSR